MEVNIGSKSNGRTNEIACQIFMKRKKSEKEVRSEALYTDLPTWIIKTSPKQAGVLYKE